jgi:hypothetical protein
MTQVRTALCPACRAVVSVTYWPFNVPLFAEHVVHGSNRDCWQSLRPIASGTDGEAPAGATES